MKGGSSLQEDVRRLEDVHLLVATVGRLLDLLDEEASLLSQCELVAMDEADKLFGPELLPILEAGQALESSLELFSG